MAPVKGSLSSTKLRERRLGLTIVHHLVELHGGTVWAESPGEEQGTTLIVNLPL
ncbi:ATP-binding protein [Phormidesmis priestleyi]|uniref:ATP-binding protein n=1 Tax=Phormidesmis priestleyi TaxID=268141 RepID=UPI0009ED1B94|nr:ATP-binding protein [Phormidesmis priestleyi]